MPRKKNLVPEFTNEVSEEKFIISFNKLCCSGPVPNILLPVCHLLYHLPHGTRKQGAEKLGFDLGL